MEKAIQEPIQYPEIKTPIGATRSESLGKLAEALSRAQGMMGFAKKESINPHFKQKYADIASVIDAVRSSLSHNGLSYVQYLDQIGNDQFLITQLMHVSGEWLSSRLKLILSKQDMQGLGAAITYARRFGLSAMVGIAQDDDDGESISNRSEETKGQSGESYPTEAQVKRLYAIMQKYNITKIQAKTYCETHFSGKNDPYQLTVSEYNILCNAMMDGVFTDSSSK